MVENIKNNNVGRNDVGKTGNVVVQHNITFQFPIQPPEYNAPMKNIPHSTLLIFRGLTFEDPDMFLFEFDVLCNRNDYQSDAQK